MYILRERPQQRDGGELVENKDEKMKKNLESGEQRLKK